MTKNVPAGVMAAGNPCEIKKIIDKDIYEACIDEYKNSTY